MSSEDTRARALLNEMQARLATGPHAALGVPSHATAADIRQAFLQLTKQFHPARFGRRSSEIQKLSNEVFLSLKAAHEMLSKPKPPPTRGNTPSSAPPNRPATRPFGVPIQPTTPPQGTRPPISTPTMPQRTPPAVATPPSRISSPAVGRAQSGTTPAPNAPPPARQSAPVMPAPSTRPSQPPPSTPGRIPQLGAPTPPRTGQSQPMARPPAQQQTQPMPRLNSTATGEALDPALAPILELMGRGDWDRAQHAIDQLALRNPQSNRYQAMSSYCRGKRAMNERRFDDARVELQTALMQDNTLDLAKSAITELMIAARRR